MSEQHPIHKAYAEGLDSGADFSVPVGRTVLCDIDDTDLTDDPRSGGYMFGSYAVGPCCVERHEETVRGYHEEDFIIVRCPEGVSFADWIRELRGPDAAIKVTHGWRQS